MSLYTVPELIEGLQRMDLSNAQLSDGQILHEAARALNLYVQALDTLKLDVLNIAEYAPMSASTRRRLRELVAEAYIPSEVHPTDNGA